ncbi:glucose-6-phosphate isomerase [Luteimonas sp. MC1572]|uniref:glucose-6-phosphate isomerase n=1 Tax=Luteimonas sp. MC1572 TaxID=2799325 RepID=UPI0018F10034|nr:glucose-6-phosphate isomerase [Luteimonas sp. MC1572]MBJ6982909.1 glucose-6-phosphate isomerase [Luteimonas sp. MC1572]QQO04133.1 glucose-6-phosphate isomerase [Luteimonas sp. MC1572]
MAGEALVRQLLAHAERLAPACIADLVAVEAGRAQALALRVGPLYASFARQRLDAPTLATLGALAGHVRLSLALRALVDGATVNATEGRPALHTALRSAIGRSNVARDARAAALAARGQMAALVAGLRDSGVTDIINVGIGGSDLGPRLVVDALKDLHDGRFRIHFVSNVDGSEIQHVLRGLDPARTAAILVSKSFSTQETLLNGAVIRDWLGGGERLYAVSANVARAEAFGVDASRVLPIWDWVGGRYSLWSTVGFAIALAVGMDGFDALLAGAAEMDAHAVEAPFDANLPIRHALVAVWNRNALGLPTQAVLPYDQRLALLPSYLQQLVMESLGKSVRADGQPPGVATVPVLWGAAGTGAQHSFFQALHQGTDVVPADFIGVVRPAHPYREHHEVLLANLLAQSEALANGHADADPHKAHAGNRPSTLLLLDALTPHALGALLAMYEHSVYAQSVLWGINAFDQWGVELGKRLAGEVLPALRGESAASDAVTRALVEEIRARG